MVQNGRISYFHGLLTLTLTLDPGMVITFFHLSLSTTCIPNFIEIEETFCGRTDVRTYGRKFDTHNRLPKFGSRPNNGFISCRDWTRAGSLCNGAPCRFGGICQTSRNGRQTCVCNFDCENSRFVFTARRYASAVYATVLCRTVCLLQAGVLSKRLTDRADFWHGGYHRPVRKTGVSQYNLNIAKRYLVFVLFSNTCSS